MFVYETMTCRNQFSIPLKLLHHNHTQTQTRKCSFLKQTSCGAFSAAGRVFAAIVHSVFTNLTDSE